MMCEWKKSLFRVLMLSILPLISSYRILGIFPWNSRSRFILLESVMRGLAKHGHQVDVISHFPQTSALENCNDIMNLSGIVKPLMDNVTYDYIYNNNCTFQEAAEVGNDLCHLMGFDEMQQLIKNPPTDTPFDVILSEPLISTCFMGLGYIFKVPVIVVTSEKEAPWVSYLIGNDDNLAYVRNWFIDGVGPMNFTERLQNVLVYYSEIWKLQRVTEKSQTELMRKYLSPDIPNIREVEKQVALTLVNTHPILSGIKPITPALVQIAGVHIESDNETLSAHMSSDLTSWMDESIHGIIYFSFGSLVLTESFPQNQLHDINLSFAKIAPVRVLMKMMDTTQLLQGLPANVKTLPWIPQQSVLAHPNTKIFITHGGFASLFEALYFGVPMIGTPLMGDSFQNVKVLVGKGMMIEIDREELCEKTLTSAMNSLLHNSTYKNKAMHYSKLFRDRPMSPLETAIFWIEYIIRNGGGTLRSPALDLSYIQFNHPTQLDIHALIFIFVSCIIFSIIGAVDFLITFFRNNICSKNKTQKVK